jgi:hypothetical protein
MRFLTILKGISLTIGWQHNRVVVDHLVHFEIVGEDGRREAVKRKTIDSY